MPKTTRKKPLYAAVRQMRWLLWHFLSKDNCAFCGETLFHEWEGKGAKGVTLHHLEGGVETDDLTALSDITKLVPAHSRCHKSYHALERAKSSGKAYNRELFRAYEAQLKAAIRQQKSRK
jgi:hypothetical protein